MSKKVIIYSTPSCHFCHMAKDYFNNHHIAYEEHNVGLDAMRRQEMVDKSGQMGVPVISVTNEDGDESIIVGFDQTALANALEI